MKIRLNNQLIKKEKLIDSECCKGITINNLCSEGDVCCYGRYDCSGTDSSELTMFLDSN